ncbi:MAG: amylo-alpha-1,6-glucosidase [Candidatus Thiodiazotropha sp.]
MFRSIQFGREICGDLTQAEQREWWLSNGKGGYAGGTIAGSLTRRYHGLLIAPLFGDMDRHMLVAKADATLKVAGHEWPLFTNRWYGDVIEPSGYHFLEQFRLEGRMPVWRFACAEYRLEMRIWMMPGEHTTYVAYRCTGGVAGPGPDPVTLSVNLLANNRDHHGSMAVRGSTASVLLMDDKVCIDWPKGRCLYLHTTQAEFEPRQQWYEGFQLLREQERGLAAIDNNLSVGHLTYTLENGQWVGFAVTMNERLRFDLTGAMDEFLEADRALISATENGPLKRAPHWIRQMLLAAESFHIQRTLPSGEEGASIIAGYPWFGDWGRDTMISLAGLTLVSGRLERARSILMSYAQLVDKGQLPNRLTDWGETAEFNCVDAGLWYFEAWRAYLEVSNDHDSLKQVFPVLQSMLKWHFKGSRYGISMDSEDSLLRAGQPGVQLTWMDAKVGEWVVTPRIGKPVEVNALWYNALRIMADFAERLGNSSTDYHRLADAVKSSFQRFHQANGHGLFDVVETPHGDDPSIRPNQILAVSLCHSPLETHIQREIVDLCARELLTSYGLRSLSPRDKAYCAHYRGGVADRDGAYHQGTVWAWLLGHYAWAEYRVTGDAAAAQTRLATLEDHLHNAGLGSISEIFDGNPPHHPRGAPAQAWSVASILEAWWRLEQVKHHTRLTRNEWSATQRRT